MLGTSTDDPWALLRVRGTCVSVSQGSKCPGGHASDSLSGDPCCRSRWGVRSRKR
jgi:hypothetical protein